MNKIKFLDDEHVYSFKLQDFAFSKHLSVGDNARGTHIKTNKRIFFKNSYFEEMKICHEFFQKINGYPHIVEYYGYGASMDAYFIFLELIDLDLKDLIQIFFEWKFYLPEPIQRNIIVSVIDALHCVHSLGLFNIDLKPASILIHRNGSIKLSGFKSLKQMANINHVEDFEYGVVPPYEIFLSIGKNCLDFDRKNLNRTDIWYFAVNLLQTILFYQLNDARELMVLQNL